MTTEAKACCKSIWNGSWLTSCRNKANVERDGKWYCGIHDPVAVKKKQDARNAAYEAGRKEWEAGIDAQAKARNELARRAGCFDDLLEALQAILPFIPKTSEAEGGAARFSENVRAADKVRAAIAKATGEQQ